MTFFFLSFISVEASFFLFFWICGLYICLDLIKADVLVSGRHCPFLLFLRPQVLNLTNSHYFVQHKSQGRREKLDTKKTISPEKVPFHFCITKRRPSSEINFGHDTHKRLCHSSGSRKRKGKKRVMTLQNCDPPRKFARFMPSIY